MDASIDEIVIDSKETRGRSIDERRLELRGQRYPISLRQVAGMTALRREITRAAAATGRDPDATGSGSPTKRLRLTCSEPGDLELFRIASFLAQNGGTPSETPKKFTFRARAPVPGGGETDTRKAVVETDATHIHYAIAYARRWANSSNMPTGLARPASMRCGLSGRRQ